MRRLEKMFWALLCGTALGAAGCGDDADMYGPPPDTTSDGTPDVTDVAGETDAAPDVPDEVIEDVVEEDEIMTAYGPLPDV